MYYKHIKKKNKNFTATNCNHEALYDLIKTAKGNDRTFSQYAKDANVSVSAFSRINSKGFIPSPEFLTKLTNENGKPRGNITLEMMMAAAGYSHLDKYNEAFKKMQQEAFKNYKEECISKIYSILIDRRVVFQKDDSSEDDYLILNLYDQPKKTWAFRFLQLSNEHPFPRYKDEFNDVIIQELAIEPDKDTKITLVISTNNKTYWYSYFYYLNRFLAFNGDVSLLFYNTAEKRFLGEFYISHSTEAKQEELYLIDPPTTDSKGRPLRIKDDAMSFLDSNMHMVEQLSEAIVDTVEFSDSTEHLLEVDAEISGSDDVIVLGNEHSTKEYCYNIQFYLDINDDEEFVFARNPGKNGKPNEGDLIIVDLEPDAPETNWCD